MRKAGIDVKGIADELRTTLEVHAPEAARAVELPPTAFGGKRIKHSEYVAYVAGKVRSDPAFVGKLRDSIAPAIFQLPDGTMLRSPRGLKNFVELMREAVPDLIPEGAKPPPKPPDPEAFDEDSIEDYTEELEGVP